MRIVSYVDQAQGWPQAGRHIMAQFDSDSIYVYQAYRPAIALYAVQQWRVQLQPHELDQTEFPLDDVSRRLGD